MKRFSKFQKISSLVLALIMTLSLAMPYMGTVEAAADDTSSTWIKGSSSTVSGNQEEGYTLSMTGTSGWASYGEMSAYKETNIKINNLKVTMDLSTLEKGKDFMLMFSSDGRHGLSSWSGRFVLLYFKRTAENKLAFYGHNGGAVGSTTAFEYDFSKPLEFEFKQDEADKWQPAINGVIYPMGDATSNSTNVFVNNLINTPPNPLYVGFMTYSSAAVAINNVKFTDKTVVEEPEEPDVTTDLTGWKQGSTSTIKGNATGGFTLSLLGSSWFDYSYMNGYETSTCITDLKVSMDLSSMNTNDEFILMFSNDGRAGLQAWNGNKVFFMLKRTGEEELTLTGHNGGAIKTVSVKFDFDSDNHVFEFLQDENGKWQLAVDGVICKMGDTNATSTHYFVTNVLKNTPAKSWVCFMNNSKTVLKIKNVKFSAKPAITADTSTKDVWRAIGSGNKVSGNATDGYTLRTAGGALNNYQYHSYFTTDYDIRDVRLILDLSTIEDSKPIILQMGYAGNGAGTWDKSKVFFKLTKSGSQLTFEGTDGSNTFNTHTISNFDFSKPFVFEYTLDNNKWQPTINGVIYTMGDTIATSTDEFVRYVIQVKDYSVIGFLHNNSTACVINNIKFVTKTNALGATIATQFEEKAPIKMGFDYKAAKAYINSKQETLVNYGAVLVSKEATAAEMQGALRAALTQGKTFTGTTYSADKKFMFTAGSAEVVPDEYAVIINNSDKVEYMDRNISAIGYIVTKASDGTYKYYFTTNVDDSKNITNGAISKSVTELLKIACEQYLEVYDVAGAEDKKTLEDVIDAFNNEQSCEYTVETLRALITSGLAAAGTEEGNLQREFLKYVHLGVRNGVPTVLSVADYGAVGDGKTDDTAAVAKVLAAAQETQKKTLIVM